MPHLSAARCGGTRTRRERGEGGGSSERTEKRRVEETLISEISQVIVDPPRERCTGGQREDLAAEPWFQELSNPHFEPRQPKISVAISRLANENWP